MPKPKVHKNFKLLTVKMLQRGKGSRYRTREVPLADVLQPTQNRTTTTKSPQIDVVPVTQDDGAGPSQHRASSQQDGCANSRSHASKKLQECTSWTEKLGLFEDAFFESQCPGVNSCSVCLKSEVTIFRCLDCGPYVMRCRDCTDSFHAHHNMLHKPEFIAGKAFVPYDLQQRFIRNNHNDCDLREKPIQVVDEKGRLHSCTFMSCPCEPETVTLIRLRLWPSTPDEPNLAFHFDLMNLLQCLLLEGRMSLETACHSLRGRNSMKAHETQLIYRGLVNESFTEYQRFRYRCTNLTSVFSTTSNGSNCPACPKESGNKSGTSQVDTTVPAENVQTTNGKPISQRDKPNRTPQTHKRKPSAYNCFMQQYLSSEGGSDKKMKMTNAAEDWRNLSAEGRAHYKEIASKMEPKPAQMLGQATFQSYVKKMAGQMETMCAQVDEQSLDWLLVCSHPSLGLTATFGSEVGESVGEKLNVGARMYAAATFNKGETSSSTSMTSKTSRRKLQSSVIDLFNEKYRAVTGRMQLSYKAVQEGRVICDGLPPQITLKKPSAYSLKALEAILKAKDFISFRVSAQPSANPTIGSLEASTHGHTAGEDAEVAANGQAEDDEVDTPHDLATLHNMVEPNEESDEYEVQFLTGKTEEDGKVFYKVKWQGYTQQTWEPAGNIPKKIRAAYKNKPSS